jgi:hypothetical protein
LPLGARAALRANDVYAWMNGTACRTHGNAREKEPTGALREPPTFEGCIDLREHAHLDALARGILRDAPAGCVRDGILSTDIEDCEADRFRSFDELVAKLCRTSANLAYVDDRRLVVVNLTTCADQRGTPGSTNPVERKKRTEQPHMKMRVALSVVSRRPLEAAIPGRPLTRCTRATSPAFLKPAREVLPRVEQNVDAVPWSAAVRHGQRQELL